MQLGDAGSSEGAEGGLVCYILSVNVCLPPRIQISRYQFDLRLLIWERKCEQDCGEIDTALNCLKGTVPLYPKGGEEHVPVLRWAA